MAIYKLNYYKIKASVQEGLTNLFFNEGRHEAKVNAVKIKFSSDKGDLIINNLTLNDLKELRKVVRKRIKGLHQRL
jgi:hypothetical protein